LTLFLQDGDSEIYVCFFCIEVCLSVVCDCDTVI